MKIFAGLGNPGKQYENTRHNAGFLFLDQLADFLSKNGASISWQEKPKFNAYVCETDFQGEKIILLKPLTFMNESGKAVGGYIFWNKLNSEDLILAHDDLDIRLGSFKINTIKGPKVHNGVNSVENHLRTKNFERIRIGIDNRENSKIEGMSYVLGRFTEEEKNTLNKTFEEIISQIFKKAQ